MWYKKYRQRTKGDSYYKSCPLPTAHADGLKLGERVWWAKTIKKEERKYVTFFIILAGLVQAAEKKVSLSLSQALLSPCIIIHSVSGFQAFRLACLSKRVLQGKRHMPNGRGLLSLSLYHCRETAPPTKQPCPFAYQHTLLFSTKRGPNRIHYSLWPQCL